MPAHSDYRFTNMAAQALSIYDEQGEDDMLAYVKQMSGTSHTGIWEHKVLFMDDHTAVELHNDAVRPHYHFRWMGPKTNGLSVQARHVRYAAVPTLPHNGQVSPEMVQLAANLQAMRAASDYAGENELWEHHGHIATHQALLYGQNNPTQLVVPSCQPTPYSRENWDLRRQRLIWEIDDMEHCNEDVGHYLSDAREALNIIDQRCIVVA